MPVNELKRNIMVNPELFDALTLWIKVGKEEKIVKGYFSCVRLTADEIPEGYNRYQLRHSDVDDAEIGTIEPHVSVNHYGDFVTKEEIKFEEPELYYYVNEWDFSPWEEGIKVPHGILPNPEDMKEKTPRCFIPSLDELFEKTKAYVKEHQGEKGYIDCQYDNLDTIYTVVYDGEYGYATENRVYGVRYNKETDDLELCYEPVMATYKVVYADEDFKNAEWCSVRFDDCIYFIPTIFSIAESIEEYVNFADIPH